MGRNGHGLHPAGILGAILGKLRQDNSQGYPFAGTDMFQRGAQLDDLPLLIQIDVSHVLMDQVIALGDGELHRVRTGTGAGRGRTVYTGRRRGEGDHIAFRVGIGDGQVYRLETRGLPCVPDGELQLGRFTGVDPQLGDGPAQRTLTCGYGCALAGC